MEDTGYRYSLHYFNGRGLGEPIRLCFAAGGITFEDIRYPLGKEVRFLQFLFF